jgi:hypothetical protein
MQIAQRLATFDQFMLIALTLKAQDLQQQPRRPLRRRLARRLRFTQQPCQAGLVGQHLRGEPCKVGRLA